MRNKESPIQAIAFLPPNSAGIPTVIFGRSKENTGDAIARTGA